ncbi:MAG: NAD(P)-binding protein [Oscillospiraceae bacterium]
MVGSGPAGLAAADQLNHRGHLVTVVESCKARRSSDVRHTKYEAAEENSSKAHRPDDRRRGELRVRC